MTRRDLHKLVVQACLGGDHFLRSSGTFEIGFNEEWDQLEPHGGREDLIQVIHPSGSVARIHLAACKSLRLPRHEVVRLLLKQPLRNGQPDAVAWAWAMILRHAQCEEITFAHDQLSQLALSDEITHHSPEYGAASYRILNDLGDASTQEFLWRHSLLD